ncbi:MAG: hypothetical protein ABI780_14605 [Ardenticatenales bacterium]
MDESTSERVIRFLVDHARCKDCRGVYHVENVHVLHQTSDRIWDLAAVCDQCYGLALIRAVVRSEDGQIHTEPASELTNTELRRFHHLRPIDRDDVLDATAFLSDFDGDFARLFQAPEDDG